MANDNVRDDRIVRRRSRRNGEAVSRLCRTWLRAGTDAFADSLRMTADLADDWSPDDCAPKGSRGGRSDD